MIIKSSITRYLLKLESLGNRLPHPALLFLYLSAGVLLLSWIGSHLGFSATHPITGESLQVVNLISVDGVDKILTSTVQNFVQFAPVGTVLVAIMGIGVAEHSGLLKYALSTAVSGAKPKLLTFLVAFTGVLSSLAADTGYVVLIPLAGLLFQIAGRHPLAGIAAAFAGVSGGYSANLLIGPLDVILSGISQEAARLVDPAYEVSPAANYYFILVSTFLVAILVTWVTASVVEPTLRKSREVSSSQASGNVPYEPSLADRKALKSVGLFTVLFVFVLAASLIPDNGILRGSVPGGSVLTSPFMKGIVVVIALYAGLCGMLFGRISGRWKSSTAAIESMEKSLATMAGYLVLMFFAAQFVSYFAWSQLGVIVAIKGATILQSIDLPSSVLLLLFVGVAACINLLVGSASAKWALLAPVFVPMLLLVGLTPEATQMAFRVGDSVTNIITPLMPYFGVVVAYAQVHDRQVGIGTIMAMMLPYSIALMIGWSALLLIWIGLDIPLGPGVAAILPSS